MERKEIQLLVISLGIVFFTLLVILLVFFFYFMKKKNRFLAEKMETDLFFQSELVKKRIEIKDQTLSEISKELHDNIGQILSVAIMQVNLFLENDNSVSKNDLSELKNVIAKSLDEIRILSRIISKDNLLKTSLVEAVQLDLDRIRKLKQITCDFECIGEPPKIDPEHELFIYRIFQEAIHNSLKHSRSDVFSIQIITTDRKFCLKMTDFGVGYDTRLKNSGIGISNMNIRAKLINAKLSIESNESGTSTLLVYPLITDNDSNSKK
jgi:signal transduction histidine kinase